MKNYIHTLFAAFFVLVITSCSDYVEGDINVDPNKPSEVSLSTLLPTIQEGVASTQFGLMFTRGGASVGDASAQINSVFDAPEFMQLSGAWSSAYLKVLANAAIIIEQAEEQNSPHYAGLAKIVSAIALGYLTDTWEGVPYSEALQGTANLSPVYDSQEAIYAQIFGLLESALEDLGQGSSVFTPSGDDLYYGGNLDKWQALANSLVARYSLHLVKKDNSYYQDVVDAGQKGILSSDMDCELNYNDRNLNPWHTGVALANNTGNNTITHSSFIIDLMNGVVLGFVDPRLPIVADKGGSEDYIGLSYDPDAPTSTVNFDEETFHSRAEAPILLLTSAENHLNMAEAFLALGNQTQALEHMEVAVKESMSKLGVDGTEAEEYWNALFARVSAEGGLTLTHILVQKCIANFLHPEVWTDMRRHNFSTEVFPGLQIITRNDDDNPLQRSRYPLDEFSRNRAQAEANQKDDQQAMWRDQ